jgi:phage terminase small subunit
MGNKNSGPRPQPTALKLLRGARKSRLNPAEPQPPPGPVDMPAGLSAGARQVWQTLAPVCLVMRTLSPADVTVFARLCELEAAWNALIAKKHTRHFRVSEMLALARELRPYSAQFGLEPTSRARLRVAQAPTVSKWADAL